MKKELLIFGSNGALGKGITKTLLTKDYDKIFLFDFQNGEPVKDERTSFIEINDLSSEYNVKAAFSSIQPSKQSAFFLYSTVGGFFGGKKLWETEESEWDQMFNMNLRASFQIAKYFSLLVKESNSGSICFTSAFTGLQPESNKAAYGSSKAALIHLVETLALEGREIKLTVNAIAPFIIDTPANRQWMKNSNYDSWMKPEEIGNLVHSIFENYHFLTGNIIELTNRFIIN
ncbi:MAG TPA: SDR family NAD(P)-dependent oxidoreductase [Ignavibacteriaceae bacterium]